MFMFCVAGSLLFSYLTGAPAEGGAGVGAMTAPVWVLALVPALVPESVPEGCQCNEKIHYTKLASFLRPNFRCIDIPPSTTSKAKCQSYDSEGEDNLGFFG